MRPCEVADEKIIDAGQVLRASGARVTGSALRRVIGAGTPSRLIKVWNDQQINVTAEPSSQGSVAHAEIEMAIQSASIIITSSLQKLGESLISQCSQAENRSVFSSPQYLAALQQISTLENLLSMTQADLDKAKADNTQLQKALKEVTDLSEHQLRTHADEVRQSSLASAREAARLGEALAAEQRNSRSIEKRLTHSDVTCNAVTERLNIVSSQLSEAKEQVRSFAANELSLNLRIEDQRSTIYALKQSIAILEKQSTTS